ncbi:hypothetical protein [Pseudomonas reidholzensis]
MKRTTPVRSAIDLEVTCKAKQKIMGLFRLHLRDAQLAQRLQ